MNLKDMTIQELRALQGQIMWELQLRICGNPAQGVGFPVLPVDWAYQPPRTEEGKG